MLLKLDNIFSMQRETPRTETALILSFLICINVVTVRALFTVFMGMPIFAVEKIYVMLMLSPIVFINFFLIFYKHRYKKIEEEFFLSWKEKKIKNIVISALYVIFTVTFFCLTIKYIKYHPSAVLGK